MKTVYRIENKRGFGPYFDHLYDYEYLYKFKSLQYHDSTNGRPGFRKDFVNGMYLYRSAYVYGFDSMKKLFAWFGGLIPQFYKYSDLRIVKYTIPDENVIYSISGKQIAFIKPQDYDTRRTT